MGFAPGVRVFGCFRGHQGPSDCMLKGHGHIFQSLRNFGQERRRMKVYGVTYTHHNKIGRGVGGSIGLVIGGGSHLHLPQ